MVSLEVHAHVLATKQSTCSYFWPFTAPPVIATGMTSSLSKTDDQMIVKLFITAAEQGFTLAGYKLKYLIWHVANDGRAFF